MSDHVSMSELVELYALDALELAEEAVFEAHLAECDLCRGQLAAALTVTASLVGDSPAPHGVWGRITSEIDGAESTLIELRPRRAPLIAITSIAATLALVLAGVLIAGNRLSTEESVVAAAERAAEREDSTTATFEVEGVAVAEVILSSDGHGFVLPTDDLADLEPARTYQLWVINEEGRVISGGVLGHSPTPSTFTWTDGVSGFALTRETAGGVEVSEGDVVAVVTGL